MQLPDTPEKGQKIYFMGIAGTGMASVAGLMQEAGYRVTGSDKGIYPPMSDMLSALGIPVLAPYGASNLKHEKPDIVVVANCLSRGHPEVEYMLENNLTYTSFPALLSQTCLQNSQNIVVAGTHGKTTTASLLAWALQSLQLNPGYFIGGVPGNFNRSFSCGAGSWFVLEGDEYDTAFFDKGSKFLHYRPEYLILNNLEFDHADIFRDLKDIEDGFASLMGLVKDPRQIIANLSDPGVKKLTEKLGLQKCVTGLCTDPESTVTRATLKLTSFRFEESEQIWKGVINHQRLGEIKFSSETGGPHNGANFTQVAGLLCLLAEKGVIPTEGIGQRIGSIFKSFKGVRRRLDLIGKHNNIKIFEDFAHHPTAVRNVLKGLRLAHPESRIIAAFEPANATSRRNTFVKEYSEAFRGADVTLIAPVRVDQRIPALERMNTSELAKMSGPDTIAFSEFDELSDWLSCHCAPGDVVVFMSSGSFAGIPKKFCQRLLDG